MAPLIPDMLSPEFGLIVAFIVGIGFGFALEQAGFSSTRKLVGLFYGYDFTVLKVFFTAGITALVGVIALSHIGALDIDRLFVNPTFMYSAIVGGAIMGAGFIIGGFCPGTSICSAAVGRLDALAFIGGGIGGILLFMEGFDVVAPLYKAGALGALRMDTWMGISAESFAIILTSIALIAFYFTAKIEDHISGKKMVLSANQKNNYKILAAVPLLILVFVAVSPSKKERIEHNIASSFLEGTNTFIKEMDTEELTFELVNHSEKYNLIDVRTSKLFENSIPTAINIPLEEIEDYGWTPIYKQAYKKNIFIAENIDEAKKAALTAFYLGDEDPIFYISSISTFRKTVLEAEVANTNAQDLETKRLKFYKNAAIQLIKLEEKLKIMRKPVEKKTVVVKGGCA
jgi:rhodanese-related sulfurtransferase